MTINWKDIKADTAARVRAAGEARKADMNAAWRKARPVYSGVLRYFPDALLEVAHCSQVGNDQHNPGEPLRWDRAKSTDEADALVRHLLQAGEIDTDGVRHTAKAAWRALALLQKEIEAARAVLPVPVGVVPHFLSGLSGAGSVRTAAGGAFDPYGTAVRIDQLPADDPARGISDAYEQYRTHHDGDAAGRDRSVAGPGPGDGNAGAG